MRGNFSPEQYFSTAAVSEVWSDTEGKRIVWFRDQQALPENDELSLETTLVHPKLTCNGAEYLLPLLGALGRFPGECELGENDEALTTTVEIAMNEQEAMQIVFDPAREENEEEAGEHWLVPNDEPVVSAEQPLTEEQAEHQRQMALLTAGTFLVKEVVAIASPACSGCEIRNSCLQYRTGQLLRGETSLPVITGYNR